MKNIKFFEKMPAPKRELLFKLSLSAALAIFWVIFLWNFWDKGVYALGLNAAIFWFLLFGLFIFALHRNGHYSHYDLYWIIPVSLIMFSYALYDNPFLKLISLLVIPLAVGVFYNQAYLPDKKDRLWNSDFILNIVARFFSFFGEIGQTVKLYIGLVIPADKTKERVALRIILGLILFLVIAFTIFIPVLSSADPVFAVKMHGIYDWFLKVMALSFVYKLLVFIFLFIFFFSVLAAWSKIFDYKEREAVNKNIDPIVSGIVLGGILALYLLFLWVQINHLWVGALPFNFNEAENLVKSGFWQLFFLTAVNIVIYFFTYKKTALIVQRILMVFSITSLLLLVSAGYRMGLYVTYYGFSYEKFFASYTVVYCAILFIWLIFRLFIAKRANIVKFLIILFLWMYALISVFPVEQFILRTNVALSNLKESRIRLYELTMLSPDVLTLVKEYQKSGELISKESNWNPWIMRQEKIILNKHWYEKNLLNFFLKEEAIKNKNEEIALSNIQKQYEEINEKLFVVSGKFICLPLKDENIAHNDLCVFGVKNSNNDYYRLQAPSDDKNNIINKIRKGQKIEISGELINEDGGIYKTLGTIKVMGVKYLYTGEKDVESNLPTRFKANYISFQNYELSMLKAEQYPELGSWVENGEIECNETPLESSFPLRINKKEINGQKYCIGASSEGAVGSVYTQYAYTTVIKSNVYLVRFIARYPSCSNYPDKERGECETERENFNLDKLVDLEVRHFAA